MLEESLESAKSKADALLRLPSSTPSPRDVMGLTHVPPGSDVSRTSSLM